MSNKPITERITVTYDVTVPERVLFKLFELDEPESELYHAMIRHEVVREYYSFDPPYDEKPGWVLAYRKDAKTTPPQPKWYPDFVIDRFHHEWEVLDRLAANEYKVEYNDLRIGEA